MVNEENQHIDREGGKKRSIGEKDGYRQAECHEGKLNSLVNVSNQGVLAAFQEQPIIRHYQSPSVSLSMVQGHLSVTAAIGLFTEDDSFGETIVYCYWF